MKRNIIVLLLWGVAVMVGCKGDEVSPIDKLMGLYQGDHYPRGFIPKSNPGSRIQLTKTTNDLVSLTVFDVRYRNLGTPADIKDFVFPKCRIVFLDTLGSNNIYQPFATIVNTENNVEMGNFRYFVDYHGVNTSTKTEYYQLRVDFAVIDKVLFQARLYKWQD